MENTTWKNGLNLIIPRLFGEDRILYRILSFRVGNVLERKN